MDTWQEMRSLLDSLSARDLLRRPAVIESPIGPRVRVGGRDVLCLCSNDYLGLSNDPAVREAAAEGIARWGVGAGASRLVSGTTAAHVELERQLADFKNAEAAVVTPTGWVANHVAISALAEKGDLILSDKLNHASIIDAALACGATVRTFAHRDVGRLERLLERHRGGHRHCLIVTDSLFSMDGDVAPLTDLVTLKRRFDAALLIDEAHATGVMGAGGRGVAELLDVEAGIDAAVGTLSKAFGTLGGFVTGPGTLIEKIRNTGRAFIYTTALPAALCVAAAEALRIIREEPGRRLLLLETAGRVRQRLNAAGISTGESVSQIIPVIIGPPGEANRVSRALFERGYFVPAIRPPSVPRGRSRLRISLSALHEAEEVLSFVDAVREVMT